MRNKLIWPAVAVICSAVIGLGIYFGLRSSQSQSMPSSYAPGSQSGAAGTLRQAPVRTDTTDAIVYATRTGECYHRAGCAYLRKSQIPMKLSEAKRRYRPCSKCGPPQ